MLLQELTAVFRNSTSAFSTFMFEDLCLVELFGNLATGGYMIPVMTCSTVWSEWRISRGMNSGADTLRRLSLVASGATSIALMGLGGT